MHVELTLTPLGRLLAKTKLPFVAFTLGGWNIKMLRDLGLNPTKVIVAGAAILTGMYDMEYGKRVLDGVLIDNENHPATPYDKLVRITKTNFKIKLIKRLVKKNIRLYFDIDGTLIQERRRRKR